MRNRRLDLLDVLNSLADGVTLADRDGRIFFSNAAADRILGIGATDAPPEAWADHYGVFLPDGATPFPTDRYPLVRALEGEETADVEMLIRNAAHPTGALIAVSGRPLRDQDGETVGAAVVFRDVTRLRRIEQMRHDLTALIVHDMKSPLTVVTTEADLMLLEGKRAPAERESLTAIRDAGWRVHRMALDLLDIHLAEDGALEAEREEVVLAALVREVADAMARRVHRAGQALVLDVPDGPKVFADPGLLRRVLQNLIDNCLKYGRSQGTIWIDAREEAAERAALRVRDDGPGVPPQLKERIFEKYASVERDDTGRRWDSRGLGLCFCRVAVEAHGGRIWVEDNHPAGAAFCMELPAWGKGRVARPPRGTPMPGLDLV